MAESHVAEEPLQTFLVLDAESYRAGRTVIRCTRDVRLYPDKLAIVDGDRRFTYREFNERVD